MKLRMSKGDDQPQYLKIYGKENRPNWLDTDGVIGRKNHTLPLTMKITSIF